jgi:hypothetical protein
MTRSKKRLYMVTTYEFASLRSEVVRGSEAPPRHDASLPQSLGGGASESLAQLILF